MSKVDPQGTIQDKATTSLRDPIMHHASKKKKIYIKKIYPVLCVILDNPKAPLSNRMT